MPEGPQVPLWRLLLSPPLMLWAAVMVVAMVISAAAEVLADACYCLACRAKQRAIARREAIEARRAEGGDA